MLDPFSKKNRGKPQTSRSVRFGIAAAVTLTTTIASKEARAQAVSNMPYGIATCRDLERAMSSFAEYPGDSARQQIDAWRSWTAGYASAYADQSGKAALKAMEFKKVAGAVMMNCYADPDKPIAKATLEALIRLAP